MRAQVSFEYLVIVGLAIMIIVPSLLFFLTFSGGNEVSATHNRVNEIGLDMVRTAANTYALGKHSWLTLDVNLPEGVEGVYLTDSDELVIRYHTNYGLSEALFFPNVALTNSSGVITAGEYNSIVADRPGIVSFKFTSLGDRINVSVVE